MTRLIVALFLVLILILLWYLALRWSQKIVSIYVVEDEEELEYYYTKVKPKYMQYSTLPLANVDSYLCSWEHNKFKLLEPYNSGLDNEDFAIFMKNLLSRYPNLDALVYSGHSSGDHIGSMDFPMMDTIDLAQLLAQQLQQKLKFIYFDSCNMGTIPWVNYFEPVATYVVGTPNYYEWQSILESPEIYHINPASPDDIKYMIAGYTSSGNGKPELLEIGMYNPGASINLWRYMKELNDFGKLIVDDYGLIEEDIYDVLRILKRSKNRLSQGEWNLAKQLTSESIVFRSRCIHDSTVLPSYLGIQF